MSLVNTAALIVIAFTGFQDKEFEPVYHLLKSEDVDVKIASTQSGVARGKFGGEVVVDYSLDQVRAGDYDAIIFIGGPGAAELKNNDATLELIGKIDDDVQILAAICIAPTILAAADVLENRRATVWSSPEDSSAIEELETAGAVYSPEPVVVDGNLITAKGPAAAEDFADAIIEKLEEL